MERPTKKPRLRGPDGFQRPKSTYKPPESITNFVSAFDTPRRDVPPSISLSKPNAPPKNPPKSPLASRTDHERPQNPFVVLGLDVPKRKETCPSKPPISKQQLEPVSFAHPPRTLKNEGKSMLRLKVLKPPILIPPAAPSQVSETKLPHMATTSITTLQPALKPPSAPSKKPRSILKPPPMPIASSSKHTGAFKPLAPPPLLVLGPASPQKNMKTILTTNIARIIDPTKEGGGAELLSLFLQQHGHNFTSSVDRELQRGVMLSPDKRSRGKDLKFVRGGLAERAQHQISCAKTDFALWKRQMERKVEFGSKFPSDMRLRMLKILHVSKAPERPRSIPVPRYGLALCRLTSQHKLASGDLTLGTYVVLFNFAPTHGASSAISSAELFEENMDVMAWMPWQKVDLAGIESGTGLLEVFATLDALNPPHSLLVMSRFCFLAPKVVTKIT
ncbi:hypothetical protein PAXRUDRAFT_494334 [Paxillus rubicundulus Ve08.2h10]|uniref:Uncharacterized protein n=1 Tax=Paxillus rubicundulus Ve08.2h10 TaxID=930991 RepID=A0A0D0E774_9AGAM|nr:hypothetical protein PAXRUDRAFT_494334 [Paxillus rubicundulus Ve08.2h10]